MEGAGYSRIFSCGKISVYILYVLGAKYGFAQSTDCAAQNMDSFFVRQSMDLRVSKGAKYKFEDNPWIALHKQLIAWFTRRSSLRYYRSQV